MENPLEFIQMATTERLTDILEHLFDVDCDCEPLYNESERIEAAKEAARRLKARRFEPRVPFNHEQFDV